jgi:glycosyltransferase involved in cell wall biosynthesis
MKIALIHELLTMKGGAERVLKILSEMFPDAPIYTLLYNEDILSDWFPPERVQGSSLQNIASRIPLPQRYNHHLYLPFFPTAVEAWDFSNFDIVLSLSSAFVHGIITNSAPKHLSYINSPARYLWDRTHEILTNAGKGILGPMRKPIASSLFHRLRVWDAEAADRADQLACSSQHVKRRVELYWGRDARVIYPPIEDFWFEGEKNNAESYYLIVSTLVPYKRIEIAIEACNALRIPLKIAGSGPDLSRLKKIAQKTAHPLEGSQVEFLGFQTENNLRDLYIHARATIFPGEEDF